MIWVVFVCYCESGEFFYLSTSLFRLLLLFFRFISYQSHFVYTSIPSFGFISVTSTTSAATLSNETFGKFYSYCVANRSHWLLTASRLHGGKRYEKRAPLLIFIKLYFLQDHNDFYFILYPPMMVQLEINKRDV